MRNVGIISCVLVVLFLLTSCGRGQPEESPVTEYPATYEAYAEPAEYEPQTPEPISISESAPEPAPAPRCLTDVFRSGHTRAEYLEDLDYLYGMFKANFPLFQPFYRRYGVCLHELFQNARHRLETADASRNYSLDRILQGDIFVHTNWFGHLWVMQDARWARSRLAGYAAWGNIPFVEVFDNPATRAFYGLTDADFEPQDIQVQAVQQYQPGNVETQILEPGNIAYVRIRQMSYHNMENDYIRLIQFYEEIANYGHLIIDIRGNPGGTCRYFLRLVMAPNISEPLNHTNYFFLPAAEHNLRFMEARGWLPYFEPVYPELFERMPYFQTQDSEILDYYMRINDWTYPSRDEAIFGGKIWLLTDEGSASASGLAAAVVRETGFATIVGAPARGGFGGVNPTILALPNTGIIVQYQMLYATCSQGRNGYEHGVPPHIQNFEGMGALETVLKIINDM